MRIVFDSNIYIAALKRGGFSAKLFHAAFSSENDFTLFASAEIIKEVQTKLGILAEKKLVGKPDIEAVLAIIENTVRIVTSKEKIKAITGDPDDDKVLECAVAASADLIVSLDKRHLLKTKKFRNIAIVHPRAFSYMFRTK